MITCLKGKTKLSITALILVLAFHLSCKKENPDVGADVIGNRTGFNTQVTDTFDLITYSTAADSVDTYFLSYYLLGQIADPVLGTYSANLITQFIQPVAGFSFNNATIDSVVLQLRYAGPLGVYGKNNSQTIKVYELSDVLGKRIPDVFFSNKTYQTMGNEIGSYTGNFNTNDSVITNVGSTRLSYAPQLRIKITDQAFIDKLKNAPASVYVSDTAFKQYFKGLLINADQPTMATDNGGMAVFNMRPDNPQTALVVYATDAQNQKLKHEFLIAGVEEVKANQYKHSNIIPTLQAANGGSHQPTCYLMPCAGIKTRILIPHLSKIAAGQKIAVQNAKITVSITGDTSIYKVPTRLNLWDAYESGNRKIITDFGEGSYYDGNFNKEKGTYSFNINRHVQKLLSNYQKTGVDVNYGFNLFIPEDAAVTANRVILDTDKTQGKVKLILTYTVIK